MDSEAEEDASDIANELEVPFPLQVVPHDPHEHVEAVLVEVPGTFSPDAVLSLLDAINAEETKALCAEQQQQRQHAWATMKLNVRRTYTSSLLFT